MCGAGWSAAAIQALAPDGCRIGESEVHAAASSHEILFFSMVCAMNVACCVGNALLKAFACPATRASEPRSEVPRVRMSMYLLR